MIDWSTVICETNRINMHYTRTGGNKPPLILLHGLAGNGGCDFRGAFSKGRV